METCRTTTKRGNISRLFLLILLALLFCPENVLSATDENSRPSIGKNDLFRADVDLLGMKKQAELSIYITDLLKDDVSPSAYGIEAIAVITVNDDCSFYGLKGQYDEKWKQIILYLHNDNSSRGSRMISGLEPVGVAGRLSGDNNNLYCRIAHSGSATLRKIGSNEIENDLDGQIRQCRRRDYNLSLSGAGRGDSTAHPPSPRRETIGPLGNHGLPGQGSK